MVDGISKEELSEAIEEGIINGFWKPIVYSAGMILLILAFLQESAGINHTNTINVLRVANAYQSFQQAFPRIP